MNLAGGVIRHQKWTLVVVENPRAAGLVKAAARKDKPAAIPFALLAAFLPLSRPPPCLSVWSAVAMALICGYYGVLGLELSLLGLSSAGIGQGVRRVCLQGVSEGLSVPGKIYTDIWCRLFNVACPCVRV